VEEIENCFFILYTYRMMMVDQMMMMMILGAVIGLLIVGAQFKQMR